MSWKHFAKMKAGISKERAYQVIRKPLITEKATLMSAHNQVAFIVSPDAGKADIKAAVESLFNVKVTAVNTLIQKGKVKRFRGVKGKQVDRKKAIVTLQEGDMIDVTTGL